MSYLYAVCAFGAYAYDNLAGFSWNIGNVADKLYLPHVLPRAVQLAGVKALYCLCKNVFAHFELAKAEFKNAEIGVIHYHTAGNYR